jgi:hypothetical protein
VGTTYHELVNEPRKEWASYLLKNNAISGKPIRKPIQYTAEKINTTPYVEGD